MSVFRTHGPCSLRGEARAAAGLQREGGGGPRREPMQKPCYRVCSALQKRQPVGTLPGDLLCK